MDPLAPDASTPTPRTGPPSRRSLSQPVVVRLGLMWILATSLVALGCADRREPVKPGRPIEVRSEGYASSDTCRSCHPSEYASWHASYHQTMTQVATPESVLGDFSAGPVRAYGESIELIQRDDGFHARVIDPSWRGPESGPPEYVERPITLVTGRHHMQIYWYETGFSRVMSQLPVAWDVTDGRWFPSDSNFLVPPRDESHVEAQEQGTWNYGCIQCHATDARPHWGGPRFTATEVSEFGIACEACHGPASEHADRYRDPGSRYSEHLGSRDDARGITNPRKLSHERGSQVCGRCHSVWRFPSNESYSRFTKTGFDYEPGDDLRASLHLVERHADAPDSFWSDDEVRPSGREYNGLIRSPCYLAGELSCFSCHTMHGTGDADALAGWRDDQLKPGMRGNAACLQCHAQLGEPAALVAHTRHGADSTGSECQNCHMPYTNQGLRKAIRSHTITNPSVAANLATGRPNACSSCHLDKPLGWAAEHLHAWFGSPIPELDTIDREVPAAVVAALRGDAGQRALAGWALGWEAAREASSSDAWSPPILSTLLEDPYPAVRSIAIRSLARVPGYQDLDYDWVGSPEERRAGALRTARRWARARRAGGQTADLAFLLAEGSRLGAGVFPQLSAERDNRPVQIRE